jgi:hypothetical protein
LALNLISTDTDYQTNWHRSYRLANEPCLLIKCRHALPFQLHLLSRHIRVRLITYTRRIWNIYWLLPVPILRISWRCYHAFDLRAFPYRAEFRLRNTDSFIRHFTLTWSPRQRKKIYALFLISFSYYPAWGWRWRRCRHGWCANARLPPPHYCRNGRQPRRSLAALFTSALATAMASYRAATGFRFALACFECAGPQRPYWLLATPAPRLAECTGAGCVRGQAWLFPLSSYFESFPKRVVRQRKFKHERQPQFRHTWFYSR